MLFIDSTGRGQVPMAELMIQHNVQWNKTKLITLASIFLRSTDGGNSCTTLPNANKSVRGEAQPSAERKLQLTEENDTLHLLWRPAY